MYICIHMYVYIDIEIYFISPKVLFGAWRYIKVFTKKFSKNMMVLSSVFGLLPNFFETGSHTCFLG